MTTEKVVFKEPEQLTLPESWNPNQIEQPKTDQALRYNSGKIALDYLPIKLAEQIIANPSHEMPPWYHGSSNHIDVNLAIKNDNDVEHAFFQYCQNLIESSSVKEKVANLIVLGRLCLRLEYLHDPEKFSSLPLSQFNSCIKAFEFGAKKYAKWNWMRGGPMSVPYSAFLRHFEKAFDGKWYDEESKVPHTGHMMCNIFIMMQSMYLSEDNHDIFIQ